MKGWGASMIGYGNTVAMLNSLRMEFGDGVTYVVGPTVKYAIWHEIGTSKMEARPFVKPAAERVQANLQSKVDQFLDGGLGDASEDAIVRSAALAVQAEMQRIITRKGIVDTGAMRASVSVEKV